MDLFYTVLNVNSILICFPVDLVPIHNESIHFTFQWVIYRGV